MVGPPAVHVEHLSKSYGDTVAVRDVSFEVQKGEVFALLGPNGAGKTTTVEILEGFRDREGRRVPTLGVDPADHSTQRWLRTPDRRGAPGAGGRAVLLGAPGPPRNAGYYPTRARRRGDRADRAREKADEQVKKLSGGQQRRLDVGLGIIGNPELLFLDEPTTGLDPSGRRAAWDLIAAAASAGTTVLLTTHYMDEVEALADRVAVLFGQEIVASGTPSSIGGRDLGAVTIRFRLPDGVAPDIAARAPRRSEDGRVRSTRRTSCAYCTSSPVGRSTAGHALQGLAVLRVSLEDIYLGLTKASA